MIVNQKKSFRTIKNILMKKNQHKNKKQFKQSKQKKQNFRKWWNDFYDSNENWRQKTTKKRFAMIKKFQRKYFERSISSKLKSFLFEYDFTIFFRVMKFMYTISNFIRNNLMKYEKINEKIIKYVQWIIFRFFKKKANFLLICDFFIDKNLNLN